MSSKDSGRPPPLSASPIFVFVFSFNFLLDILRFFSQSGAVRHHNLKMKSSCRVGSALALGGRVQRGQRMRATALGSLGASRRSVQTTPGETKGAKPLLMIPGPIEFSEGVLQSISLPTLR